MISWLVNVKFGLRLPCTFCDPMEEESLDRAGPSYCGAIKCDNSYLSNPDIGWFRLCRTHGAKSKVGLADERRSTFARESGLGVWLGNACNFPALLLEMDVLFTTLFSVCNAQILRRLEQIHFSHRQLKLPPFQPSIPPSPNAVSASRVVTRIMCWPPDSKPTPSPICPPIWRYGSGG